MKRASCVIFCFAAFLITMLLTQSPSIGAPDKVLTIGFSTVLSGRAADYGRHQKQGVTMAVDEINGKGGVNGVKFEVITEDDKGDPKESANVAQKFVADARIKVVIGPFSSPSCFAAGPIYQRAKLAIIPSLASNSDIPKQGNYIFQNSSTHADDAPGTAHYLVNVLKAKKIALVYINDDFGRGYKQHLEPAVEKLGGEFVAAEAYNPGEVDYRNLLIKINNTKPDALFGACYAAESAQVVIQAKELKVPFPISFSGGTMSSSYLKLGGKAVEDTVIMSSFIVEDPDPYVQDFVKNFRSTYNEDPNLFSAYPYDTVYLIATAIRSIKGEITRSSLRDALAGLKNIKTLVGDVSADQHGHFGPRKMVYVIVKDGAFKYHGSFTK